MWSRKIFSYLLFSLFQGETDVDIYGSEASLLKVGVDCVSNPWMDTVMAKVYLAKSLIIR